MTNFEYWYPWSPARYRADTLHLSCEEDGIYRRLIDHYMETRLPLPGNKQALCRIVGISSEKWDVVSLNILSFFRENDGKLYHKKCDEILLEQDNRSSQKKERAINGAATRWESGASGSSRSQRISEARKKGKHTKEEWDTLIQVCEHKCVKCGASKKRLEGGVLCKDHILPIYKGGSDSIENIQPMCRNCNASKGPENKDYRPIDWRERLQNACKTPAKRHAQDMTGKKIIISSSPLPPASKKVDDDDLKKNVERVRGRVVELVPKLKHHAGGEIRDWIESGADVDREILPAIERTAKNANGEIHSFAYFTPEIQAAIAGSNSPAPPPKTEEEKRASRLALYRWKRERGMFLSPHEERELDEESGVTA